MSLFGTDLGFAFNPLLNAPTAQNMQQTPQNAPVQQVQVQSQADTQVFIPPIKKQQSQYQSQNLYRPMPPLAAPSLQVQQVQKKPVVQQQQEKGYLDILFTRKRDIMKLVILSMVIVLGISVHSFINFALNESIVIYKMNFKKEVILRAIYPIVLFFIMWNLKAFA